MDMNIFIKAMEVGYYFNAELNKNNDKRIEDWTGSEDCTTFTKIIIDYAEENGCDINAAFYEIFEETINNINNKLIPVEDHMWDEYCKGFLAGEILGYPSEKILWLVFDAEKLWKNSKKYGYYQEVLEEVAKTCK